MSAMSPSTAIPPLEGWLGMTQASLALGWSMGKLRLYADAGKLRAIRTPHGRLINAEDVARIAGAEQMARDQLRRGEAEEYARYQTWKQAQDQKVKRTVRAEVS